MNILVIIINNSNNNNNQGIKKESVSFNEIKTFGPKQMSPFLKHAAFKNTCKRKAS